jgi:putative transposase
MFQHPKRGGQPRPEPGIKALIIRIACENARLGYDKIHGELLKPGFRFHPSTVKTVLRRQGLQPARQRGGSSCRTFLKHYRPQILACDFFIVETVHMETLYVLFFTEFGSRRVHLPS